MERDDWWRSNKWMHCGETEQQVWYVGRKAKPKIGGNVGPAINGGIKGDTGAPAGPSISHSRNVVVAGQQEERRAGKFMDYLSIGLTLCLA
jgi:hypothetical protein